MSGCILVVEDNEKNRVLVRDVLAYYGYKIIEAKDGSEAIALAREHVPDLIIMDIQMPVMDGLTAARLLRDDPRTCNIRMIALTSFAMKGDREKILGAGFLDYVAKPVDTRALPKIVAQCLQK